MQFTVYPLSTSYRPLKRMTRSNSTVSFYNNHAQDFIEGTLSVDVSHLYAEFESHLSDESRVLDVGCGSGRDLKYFAERGYQSTGLEPSSELAAFAEQHSGQKVICGTIQDTDWRNEFDGIWCCASLLHVTKDELGDVFQKLARALKHGGAMYVSFKYGESEEERNGRFFTDLTEESLAAYVTACPELTIEKTWLTGDARPGREHEKWLNAMVSKSF